MTALKFQTGGRHQTSLTSFEVTVTGLCVPDDDNDKRTTVQTNDSGRAFGSEWWQRWRWQDYVCWVMIMIRGLRCRHMTVAGLLVQSDDNDDRTACAGWWQWWWRNSWCRMMMVVMTGLYVLDDDYDNDDMTGFRVMTKMTEIRMQRNNTLVTMCARWWWWQDSGCKVLWRWGTLNSGWYSSDDEGL